MSTSFVSSFLVFRGFPQRYVATKTSRTRHLDDWRGSGRKSGVALQEGHGWLSALSPPPFLLVRGCLNSWAALPSKHPLPFRAKTRILLTNHPKEQKLAPEVETESPTSTSKLELFKARSILAENVGLAHALQHNRHNAKSVSRIPFIRFTGGHELTNAWVSYQEQNKTLEASEGPEKHLS